MGRGWISIAMCCLGAACQRKLDEGTDIIWSADHESGDLSEWAAPGVWSGGEYLASADASVAISTEQAHSGQYSVKLSTPASNGTPSSTGGGGLFKEGVFSTDAYYSVWYFLPRAYTTTTSWTVLKFRSRYSATVISEVLDIRLQSLPSGDLTLVVFDARHAYLQSPLPDPPSMVPIGRWFQLEAFYRDVGDSTGRLTIWLDGTQVYDLSRPTGPNPAVYFTPCNLVDEISPSPAEIYIDDVAISASRVTPNGILKVNP